MTKKAHSTTSSAFPCCGIFQNTLALPRVFSTPLACLLFGTGVPATPAACGEQMQPELQAYMNRHSDSADWNPQFADAANRFITRAKTAGWWNRMSAVYFFCAPTRDAALHNARSDTLHLTLAGGITFEPYSGMRGDGATGYLETNTAPGNIPGWSLNEHSMFVFSQSDNPSLAGEVGAMGGGTNIGIRVRDGAYASIWSNNITYNRVAVSSGFGLTGFVRTGPEGGFITKNGAQTDFIQQPDFVTSGKMRFFRIGISQYHSLNKLAFGFFGDSAITKDQARDIYEACLEMLGEDGMGTLDEEEARLPATPPHAFARESIEQVTPRSLKVFRMTSPPANDSLDFVNSFPNGPLTDCVTRPWGGNATSADTQVRRWELIWSDRALGPEPGVHTAWAKKPNDTMGIIRNAAGFECRTEFTSYEKAIGSTLVKTAYTAGLKFRADPDHPDRKGWGDIAEEWGYNVDIWQTRWEAAPDDPVFTTDMDIDTGDIVHRKFCAAPANTGAFFCNDAISGVYRTSRDRVILGPGRSADMRRADGILIDHEHADSRTPEMQLKFLTEMRKIANARGLGLVASGHPPTTGTGYEGGWRPGNAHQLLSLLDWFVIIPGTGLSGESLRANLEEQYNFYKGPDGTVPSERLCLQISIGADGQEIPLPDVRIAREFMMGKGIPQCIIVPLYAKLGGSIERMPNQVVATLLGLATEPVEHAPEITAQPRDTECWVGAAASFAIAATPNGPVPSCQWYHNNDAGLIPGATSHTLTINNAQLSHAGSYYAKIGNGAFTTVSDTATLTVSIAAPPSISWAPGHGSQTVLEGAPAAFAVNLAAGSAPLVFRWWKNNTLITGATTAAHTTPATTFSDNGAIFKVEVVNSIGTASLNATLNVTPGPATVAQQIKTQLETPGAGTVTINGEVELSLVGGGTIASGKTIVGANAGASITGNVTIPADATDVVITGVTFASGSLGITGASGVSVTNCTFIDAPISITNGADGVAFAWNEFTATGPGGAEEAGGGSAMTIDNAGAVTEIVLDHNLWGDGLKTNMPLATNARVNMFNNYFAATGNTNATVAGAGAQILSVNNIYQDVKNPLSQQNGGLIRAYDNFITPGTALTIPGMDTVFVPAESQVMQSAGIGTPGAAELIDLVTTFAGSGSSRYPQSNATARITATVSGTGASANTAGAVVPAAAGFTLTASASNFTPVAWQWYRNNFAIAGASARQYEVKNATAAANAGAYSVALTTSATGSDIVTAGAFTVAVGELAPPVITTHPLSQTVTAGADVTFSVTATGDMLLYQWKRSGADIPGANGADYTIHNTRQTDAASYTVVVSNQAEAVTSNPATLAVTAAGTGAAGAGSGGGGGAPGLLWIGAVAVMLALRKKVARASSP